MKPAAACSLVFFTLCSVQCQWVQFVNNDISLNNSSTEALLTSDSGWSPHSGAVQFVPTTTAVSRTKHSQDGRRVRRQAYVSRNSNFGGEAFSWTHYFTIPPVYSNTKEPAYVREENMKRLKNTLEKDTVFQFLNPSGLRISIPADNVNIRIVDFRFKVNEEFRSNDGGHYAPTSYKRGGFSTYDIPELQVKQGDKVYYWMSVMFMKGGTDATVKGVLEITRGNPHLGGGLTNPIPFRPTAPVLGAQPQLSYGSRPTPSLGGGFGGGTRGAFVWTHQFTINATYGSGFSQSSANSWLQQAELLKGTVENIDFRFSNPTGLMILIPDNNINMRIEDLRLKVNEEFRGNDGGHYAPTSFKRGSMLTYNVPDLRASQGDRIFYSMRIKLGKDEFDSIVRGVLAISQGDPHNGANGISMRPPSFSRPQSQPVNTNPSISVGGSLDGGGREVRWEHRFSINTTYNAAFTVEQANRWFDEAQLFKKTLEKDIEFKFYNPMGISVSIAGVGRFDNEGVRILSHNVKLNEDFQTLTPGDFVANITKMKDGRWTYFYQDLKVKQGDRIYYWMRVQLGKQEFDNIVKGVLEIIQGNPHSSGDVAVQPAQPNPVAIQSPPASPLSNKYPQTYPNPYNPPSSRPNQYNPPSSRPNPYNPPSSRPNQYNPSSRPNQYTTTPRPNQYTTTPRPNQYTTTPPSNQYSPPTPPSQPTDSCKQTSSTASRNGDTTPPCKGQVMFEEKFNNLDGWTHQISIGGNDPEDEFTCFTKYDENTWAQQGRLHIKPTLLEDRSNDSFVRGGELILDGCTLNEAKYCHRRGQGYTILPPVNSARINTENTFSFRYGILEMKAKLPQGDWLVPELWLEPKNPAVKEKMVVGVSTGNAGKTANQMAAGVVRESDKWLNLKIIVGSSPMFQGFHTFRLEWTPDNVKFFMDNRKIHELPADSFTIFRHEVYISLGVHAGGFRDFPNDVFPNKPWEDNDVKRIARFWDQKDAWHPTWKNNPTLEVEYIKVTAL